MEKYTLLKDLVLYSLEVKAFPNGVKDTFDILYNALGEERSYYGISWMDEDNSIKYYAAVADLTSEEQKQFAYETLIINAGEYLTVTILNWMSKTDSVKDVFHDLVKDRRPNRQSPCIEWYKSDDEMICMVKS